MAKNLGLPQDTALEGGFMNHAGNAGQLFALWMLGQSLPIPVRVVVGLGKTCCHFRGG